MESEFKGETLKDCFYLCLNKLKCGDFNGELNLLRACTDVLLEKIAEFVEELPSTAQVMYKLSNKMIESIFSFLDLQPN